MWAKKIEAKIKQIIVELRLKVRQPLSKKIERKEESLKWVELLAILASLERFEHSTHCLEVMSSKFLRLT